MRGRPLGICGEESSTAETDSRQQAIKSLSASNNPLGNNTILEWCKYLKETDSTFVCVQELVQPSLSNSNVEKKEARLNCFLKAFKEKLQEAKEESGVVFVPFVLESWLKAVPLISNFSLDHIVVLAVNTQNKTFEYYDSQGGTIEQEKRTVVGLSMTARELLNELKEYTGQWNTLNSTQRHQTDFVNCGVFVSNFMDRRRTQTFDQICKDKGIDPASYRKAMIANLQGK